MADIAMAATAVDETKDPLASLAGLLRHASTGTLARLRRSDPARDPQSSLFDTERLLLAAEIRAFGPDRERWALVLHCLALVQGRHDTRSDAEPGRVLKGLHFSEARLRQLVEADRPMLFALLPRLARRVAVAGAAMNWWPLATLLLHAGTNDPQREALVEQARQRLVRHYLAAEVPAAPEAASTDQDA